MKGSVSTRPRAERSARQEELSDASFACISDIDVIHRKILERTRLSHVLQELGTLPCAARSLHEKVICKEFAEALVIAVLIRPNVVIVQLLKDRQIAGRRLDIIHIS
ncbi:hypothetical protein [Streptomyces sp. NPDC002265]|uniref:hypothetical protein n=1 Tax=Streptomyces sp. NPDC002265 TaxID=3154415 RepID=UPI003316BAD0